MATTTDYLKLHFIVFLWGFTAILGLLISIPTVEMVFYRTLLAALGMGVFMAWSKGSFKVSKSDGIKLLLIGFIVCLHWLAFFGSARASNASVSLVGFATNSLWAALLEPWMNRNRVKKFELLLGIVVIVGLYVIFSFNFEYKLGLALGIAAGFSAALFSVLNAKMVRRVDSYAITFYEMVGAFIATAVFLPIYKHTLAAGELKLIPSLMDWVYIALLAWVCTVYAFSMAVKLMKKLSVFFIQLTLNLEPVYGIIMALIILGDSEKMGFNFYVGTLIIISAVASYPWLKKRFDKPAFMR
ncbi:MAG: DMT family transporter [Cyclobacteriaceae bacterium]|nr:DMT family transporter [Cyclobacteriaceae bacterium]UYN86332.1 MAG: DMT family transporter [Cyclobacteriaceae bacterium]